MGLSIYVLVILAGHVISLIYGVDMMELGSDVSNNNNSSSVQVSSSLNVITRRASLNQWSVLLGMMLIIEYVVWDLLLMPLFVILLSKSKSASKIINLSITDK